MTRRARSLARSLAIRSMVGLGPEKEEEEKHGNDKSNVTPQ